MKIQIRNYTYYNKKQIFTIFFLLLFILFLIYENTETVFAAEGKNITQNWAAAAVFYHTAAEETETFRMTEEEFLTYKTNLESRLVFAYSIYYNSLNAPEQAALEASQKAWLDCYDSYTDALRQRWINPVKIYFGVTGKERRTNVYREFIMLFLTNRITDLEEWNAGSYAKTETDFTPEKVAELEQKKEQLQVDMGLCLYVIQEEYRPKIKEAHRTFFTFLESNEKFISLISNNNETIITAEELLQVQRMDYLTGVQYQGCRFFRREREE